jgi:hypothetical protein
MCERIIKGAGGRLTRTNFSLHLTRASLNLVIQPSMSMVFWRSDPRYTHECEYNPLQKVVNLLSAVKDIMFCCLEQL